MKTTRVLAKEIMEYCDLERRESIELAEKMLDSCLEFCSEDDSWRFIHVDSIDGIQQEELENDLYVLGCFNANFLSGILGIDCDAIEAIQQAEAFEALGKMIVSMGKLESLQQAYKSADGYGHHFNHNDGSEIEISDYFVFRTN